MIGPKSRANDSDIVNFSAATWAEIEHRLSTISLYALRALRPDPDQRRSARKHARFQRTLCLRYRRSRRARPFSHLRLNPGRPCSGMPVFYFRADRLDLAGHACPSRRSRRHPPDLSRIRNFAACRVLRNNNNRLFLKSIIDPAMLGPNGQTFSPAAGPSDPPTVMS